MTRRDSRPGDRAATPTQGMKVPIGIEKVLYRAAADPEFKDLLMRDRAGALDGARLRLTATEQGILGSVPKPALARMIERIDTRAHGRGKVMKTVAAVALAATTALAAVDCVMPVATGAAPDLPDSGVSDAGETVIMDGTADHDATRGSRP